MGEREPIDNPEPTHGICEQHKAQVLESLPSRSFPDVELLIVVPRNDTALYERQRSFARVSGVRVVMDRRVADRRWTQGPVSDERRGLRTRRLRQGEVSSLGYTVVRFTPRVTTQSR